MNIANVYWADESQAFLHVVDENGQVNSVKYFSQPDPEETWHMQEVRRWIEKGNSIQPYQDPTDYMALMRAERDRRIQEIYWRVERYQTQTALGITPTDNAQKMQEIYQYLQDLRDMPENNPNVTTKAQYEALQWPTKPE